MNSKASIAAVALLSLLGFTAFSGMCPDACGKGSAADRIATPEAVAPGSAIYSPHFMPLNPDVVEKYKATGQKVPLRMTEARFTEREGAKINQLPRTEIPLDQTIKAIVLLVEFTDDPPGGPTARFSPGVWDSMLFGNYYVRGGADTTTIKTLKRFYDEVSFGTVDIVTVDLPSSVGWDTAPQNYTYYCDDDGIHDNGFGPYPRNVQRLVMDAVIAADPSVDFSQYAVGGVVQNLFVVHAGSGAEWSGGPILIWSHAWDIRSNDGWGHTPPTLFVDGVQIGGYSMEPECGGDTAGEAGSPMTPMLPTVGVYCHEFGHVLGLPDEYDYGYESSGTGRVSLMAGGSWNRVPNVYPDCAGNSPAHPSAWGATYLGFVTPTEVTTTTTGVTIPPIEQTGNNAIYKVTYPGSSGKEYWLFENRQQTGFDEGFANMTAAAHGLVIYHVDENVFDRTFWLPNEAECVSGGVYQGVTNCDCASLPANSNNGEKWYGLSVEQADGLYQLELGTSSGYWQDFYSSATGVTAFDDTTVPNTSSYYSTYSCDAFAAATNIQESGGNITLDLTPDSFAPSVTLSTPNGGESYLGGTWQTITWSASDNLGVTSIDIYLSDDGGSSYPYTVATDEPNDGTYDWKVPDLGSSNCLIKVVAHDAALNEASDESDSAFEISPGAPTMSWPGVVFLCVALAAVAFLFLLRRRRRT
jgi:immune inhibitor A